MADIKPETKKDKQVLELKKKGLSFAEIGKKMGVHKQTAYNRYLRISGKRKLSTRKFKKLALS